MAVYRFFKTTYQLETDRLNVGLRTACLMCGNRFAVGPAAWAFKVGAERIGYFCPACLNDKALAQLVKVSAQVNVRTSDDD